MRVVVAGTPEVAVPALDALVASSHDVVAVLTRPDAPLGRKRILTPSPLAARAEALNIPVLKSAKPGEEVIAQLRELGAELGVVVAYGALLREPVLAALPFGWINLHFSALPKWRGAAPLQRAIMAGESETALTVFQLEQGLDTGPIFSSVPVPLPATKTSGELLEEYAVQGAELLVTVVNGLEEGSLAATPQIGDATHAAKLTRDDGLIDWTRDAQLVSAQIRSVTPEPGARTEYDGAWLKVHAIAASTAHTVPELVPGEVTAHGKQLYVGTGTDPIELITVQPAGKQAMSAMDWWRGTTQGRTTDERLMLG